MFKQLLIAFAMLVIVCGSFSACEKKQPTPKDEVSEILASDQTDSVKRNNLALSGLIIMQDTNTGKVVVNKLIWNKLKADAKKEVVRILQVSQDRNISGITVSVVPQ